MAKIEECYKNSNKKIVMTKHETTFFAMLMKYGILGLVYIIFGSLIVCGGPYLSVWS